jgi:hypothetical protein
MEVGIAGCGFEHENGHLKSRNTQRYITKSSFDDSSKINHWGIKRS